MSDEYSTRKREGDILEMSDDELNHIADKLKANRKKAPFSRAQYNEIVERQNMLREAAGDKVYTDPLTYEPYVVVGAIRYDVG